MRKLIFISSILFAFNAIQSTESKEAAEAEKIEEAFELKINPRNLEKVYEYVYYKLEEFSNLLTLIEKYDELGCNSLVWDLLSQDEKNYCSNIARERCKENIFNFHKKVSKLEKLNVPEINLIKKYLDPMILKDKIKFLEDLYKQLKPKE